MFGLNRLGRVVLGLAVGIGLPPEGFLRGGPPLSTPRAAHTATLLPGGQVLLVGGCTRPSCELDERSASAELYDPASGSLRPTGRMTAPRVSHTATRLQDGRVLIAGGWTVGRVVDSAEVYDPRTGRFEATGEMHERRSGHTATLLADGRVLLAGGTVREGTALNTAEVYDPARGTFRAVGTMTRPRAAHVAVLLRDGRVLIAGGHADRSGAHASVEVFTPATGTFAVAGPMTTPRNKFAGVVLPSGRVLLLGGTAGYDRDEVLHSAEVYDPAAGRSRASAPMGTGRYKFTDGVTALADGRIFVAGGGRAEIYDEQTDAFSPVSATLPGAEQFMTTTAFPGGVLVAGGYDTQINPTNRSWVWRDISGP
ncbi:Kelch repeat-containing protein [Deinococcus apachensis]|uniref:Kelch repeat-containing protein n=1 Tax=Deinococcus apachensis TaxID=309886 RepID=UPI000365CEC4|nr:kelch repeat-containing protein [Deinococcus apachensis]